MTSNCITDLVNESLFLSTWPQCFWGSPLLSGFLSFNLPKVNLIQYCMEVLHKYGLFKVILYISFIKRYVSSQSTAIFLLTCISKVAVKSTQCTGVSKAHIPFRKHTTCSFFADSVLELIGCQSSCFPSGKSATFT